jgi:predicted permease
MKTARIPLLRGRALTPPDDVSSEAVALVNETFVRENFPGQEPLGKRVRMLTDFGYGIPTLRIVGVVGDIRSEALKREPIAEIYVPHGRLGAGFMTVTVRGVGDVAALVPAIRKEVMAIDPRQPLRGVETLEDAIRREVAPTRFFMILGILFAGFALLLAAVGLYGVLGYLVSQRKKEIGIRAALGASGDKIVRMVVAEGLSVALLGAAAGLAIALWSSRLLNAFLYAVEPWDPAAFVGSVVVLLAVAVLASVIPARRASTVHPVDALRVD